MEFREKIKHLRKSKRMTQSDLADLLKIAPTAVSAWERGANRPLMDKVVIMADYFNVPLSYFFEQEEFSPKNIIRIPILGQIACGNPILADENIIGYREELISQVPNGNVFYLETKGDSMIPTIPENSYVMIREQSDVEDGEIAAVLVNGDEETTLKRVKRQGDIVMLVADNPSYPPYIITKDNPARILGKAIKFSADL